MTKSIRRKNELIARAAIDEMKGSRQPRFSDRDKNKIFWGLMKWINLFDDEPTYSSNSSTRDSWLQTMWRREPHIAGVINSVCQIDKNRGWSLVGGRNQVMRFTNVLHNWFVTASSYGWRAGIEAATQSFYTTDMGAVVEIGREGQAGPVRGFYHVDPLACTLTDSVEYPLEYTDTVGVRSPWRFDDYFRLASMVNIDQRMRGIGFCALSRCIELTKIMVGVYQYDLEQLGARAPRGLLILNGISEDAWIRSLKAREEKLDELERNYYGGVQILAGEGLGDVEANIVGLSNLPAEFNMETFTNLVMYGYALCFGYDPREFYPVSGGTLGTGHETEAQSRKASGKGGADFILQHQEKLAELLPDTLQMEYDERDTAADLVEAEFHEKQAMIIEGMYDTGLVAGASLVTREEARIMLAEAGLIPEEWTEQEEEVKATDTESVRKRYLKLPAVQRAAYQFPDDPIVRYSWKNGRERMIVISEKGSEAISRLYAVERKPKKILFKKSGVVITDADVDRAIEQAREREGEEYAQLLEGKPLDNEAE